MSLRCIEDFVSPQHICRQALWLEIYVIVHNIVLVDKLIGSSTKCYCKFQSAMRSGIPRETSGVLSNPRFITIVVTDVISRKPKIGSVPTHISTTESTSKHVKET